VVLHFSSSGDPILKNIGLGTMIFPKPTILRMGSKVKQKYFGTSDYLYIFHWEHRKNQLLWDML